MKVKFPGPVTLRLMAVRSRLNGMSGNEFDPEELARACDRMAGTLTGAAALIRRHAKRQNKSGAAGAVHDTK